MTVTLDRLTDWEIARVRWHIEGRATQIPPETDPDWDVWFYMAGRGTGKTRAGAEDVSEYARSHPDARVALVAPTFADARDTMVEGESGLLRVLPESALRGGSWDDGWNRSIGEVYFANGARAKCFSSEKPNRLRGPQHHRAWVDEPAAFRDAHLGDALDTTWNNLMLGLRLGDHPRAIVTGTPKRNALVKALLARPAVRLVRGSTYENLANLAPTFRDQILARYEGTRIARQELHGELLEDVEGALWNLDLIEQTRVGERPDLTTIVVAVDPAVTVSETSDETGIVAAGLGTDGQVYVLADATCKASPEGWARVAIDLYDGLLADRMVVEQNQGYDLLQSVIRSVDPTVPVVKVNAAQGKHTRAQPVAALYEQGRVHHVGAFPELEDQLVTWTPEDPKSPDRLDALVWAVTDLALGPPKRRGLRG